MQPDERLPDPEEVESLPLPQRADAYLEVHRLLQQRAELGPA